MSSSESSALTKRSASTALMAPPPAPKRIKRPNTVLDEDTYTSAISHIIRRDFFPGLAETDAQQEYLNALESKDNQWIREAGARLTSVMTPVGGRARNTRFRGESVTGGKSAGREDLGRGKTPSTWGKDTPRTEAGSDEEDENEEGLGRLDKVDLDMSLGAFQAKYTSEDQESFNKILDAQNRKRFEKNDWLRSGNRYASKQRIAQQKVLEGRASTSSNEVALRPSQNLDDRPAAPNTHKHVPFNTLMFPPESIDNHGLSTRAQDAEAASLAPPKRVLHANTRLPTLNNEEPSQPPSPTTSAIRDAIAGNPRLGKSEGGYTGSETPRVNGYAFVDALPPDPDSEEEAPTNLLEKFGPKASSSAPFKISESLPREKLHHKMVDKISASKRVGSSASASAPVSSSLETGKKLGLFTSATPRFMIAPTPGGARSAQGGMTPGGKQVGGLTPAGKRLFQSMGGGTPRTGGSVAGGFGEGRQWTPTPRVKRKM